MSSTDRELRIREPRRPGGAGSMLASLLPGLLSLALVFAAVPIAMADGHEPGSATADAAEAADPMKAMLEERLAGIPSGDEGVAQIMGELDKRLELSEAQEAEIQPIIQKTVASMEKSRDRFKAGEISPMALGMQLQMAGQKAATQVEPLLTDEQQTRYAAMRQEQRREMMKAMQQARGLGGPAPAGAQ